jgi:hypothetical protein
MNQQLSALSQPISYWCNPYHVNLTAHSTIACKSYNPLLDSSANHSHLDLSGGVWGFFGFLFGAYPKDPHPFY